MLSAAARVRRGFRRLGVVAASGSVLIGGVFAFSQVRDYVDGPKVYCGGGRGFEKVHASADREAEFIRLTTLCPPSSSDLLLNMPSLISRAAIREAVNQNAELPGYAAWSFLGGVASGAALWGALELLSWLIRGFMRE